MEVEARRVVNRKEEEGKRAKRLLPTIESAVKLGLTYLPFNPTEPEIIDMFKEAAELYKNRKNSSIFSQLMYEVDDYCDTYGLGDRHRSNMKSIGSRFDKIHGDSFVWDISKGDVNEFLKGLNVSPLSVDRYKSNLGSVFSIGIDFDWLEVNPCKKRKKSKNVKRGKAIEIFPLDTIRLLMKTAPEEMIPFYAITLFAGVRRSELESMEFEHINWEEKEIYVYFPKTGGGKESEEKRIMPMEENLQEWIFPFRNHTGKIIPADNYWKDIVQPHRASIGLYEKGKGHDQVWGENVLRHCFGTYHLARGEDIALTAARMGNTPQVVRANYVRVRPQREGEEFFGITRRNLEGSELERHQSA